MQCFFLPNRSRSGVPEVLPSLISFHANSNSLGAPLPIIELFFSYDAGNQVSQTAYKKDEHGPASKRPD